MKNCKENLNVIVVNSAVEETDSISLFTDSIVDLRNGYKYTIVIPRDLIIPVTNVVVVILVINDVKYFLTDRTLGNMVYNDQLRFVCTSNCGNKVLRTVYGENEPHFKIISQCLPQSLIIGD